MSLERKAPPLIAVSMGDPAGIGPEVILKAAAALGRRRGAPRMVVVGDLDTMAAAARRLRHAPALCEWPSRDARPASPARAIGVIQTGDLSRAARVPGRPTAESGGASFEYVVAGAQMVLAGEADALVTAPISKEWWERAGHHHPGHSELLAEIARVRQWRMMFAGGTLRLALVTVHMGLAKVSAALTTAGVLGTIRLLARHMRGYEATPRPKIAVLGFNPHAGEHGLFGDEEIRAVTPAIRRAQREGIRAFGPLPPDTAFIRPEGRFNFDAAVAMYHDQGLIALKTLEFDRGVNITLGLPFVRTAPDHGTAFNLAGRGVANPSSMLAALGYAWRMVAAGGGSGRIVKRAVS
jgi:4-hydroxythreonine-4-phosphate dehydrogenase